MSPSFPPSLICMVQVGIFRKSGVKSRIQNLRQMNESSPDNVCYEGQSAYDVADLLKQYFRDLPEPIFTSKLTTTFMQIYQRELPVLIPDNLTPSQPSQRETTFYSPNLLYGKDLPKVTPHI